MECIYCSSKTKVINSRKQKNKLSIWRRRQCLDCNNIFTTSEKPDLEASVMVKNFDGTLEPFSADKLFLSLLSSCSHRKSMIHDARALTDTVTRRTSRDLNLGFISQKHITDTCLEILDKFDKPAYTYFKAHYMANN
jgi:transcriptional repressor NrdR